VSNDPDVNSALETLCAANTQAKLLENLQDTAKQVALPALKVLMVQNWLNRGIPSNPRFQTEKSSGNLIAKDATGKLLLPEGVTLEDFLTEKGITGDLSA